MDDDDVEDGAPLPKRLEGIWALHRAAHGRRRPPPKGMKEVTQESLRDSGWKPDAEEAEAWRQSGWQFVHLRDEDPFRRGPVAHEDAVLAPVYLTPKGPLWVTAGRVLVQAPKGWSRAEIAYRLEGAGLSLRHVYAGPERLAVAGYSSPEDPLAICRRLVDEHDFTQAEPEFLTAAIPAWRPNDPEYDTQWSWRNHGQGNPAGTVGADVSAERAWRISRGAGAIIGIIDGAFDATHEDLAAGVHANSGYFTEVGGVVSFHRTTASTPGSGKWHGTMCAGRAAARADNRRQGCGMAPEADLLLIAMNGLVSAINMARAIEYCADPTREDASLHAADGADVISCSLKPNFVVGFVARILMNSSLRFAGRFGRGRRGCFIAWAAPNSSGSVDSNFIYKSKYVSVVAMTDRHDFVRKSGTVVKQGTGNKLKFVAPGNSVYSTAPGASQLYADTGCSFATPVVVGLAALCVAVNPRLRSISVYLRIRDGCDKVGDEPYVSGRNNVYGYGRINAGETVSKIQTNLGLGPWP